MSRGTLNGPTFFLDLLKEVKSQFTDWLRLHGKSQVSDSMSKNTVMTTV